MTKLPRGTCTACGVLAAEWLRIADHKWLCGGCAPSDVDGNEAYVHGDGCVPCDSCSGLIVDGNTHECGACGGTHCATCSSPCRGCSTQRSYERDVEYMNARWNATR